MTTIDIGITSDTHYAYNGLVIPKVDLLIHAGDLALTYGDLETVKDFYGAVRTPLLDKNPDSWMLVCPGNHDSPFGIELLAAIAKDKNDSRFVILQHQGIHIDEYGLSIFGSPYASYESLNPRFRQYHEDELALKDRWDKTLSADPKIDILVTHSPAYGILDGIGLGANVIRNVVEMLSPTIHAFGHVHSSWGVHQSERINKKTVLSINAAAVNQNNKRLEHQPIIVSMDVSPNNRTVQNILAV